jgi:hypothetical protein
MLNWGQRTFIFLGDMMPLFLIALIQSAQPFHFIEFVSFLFALLISVLGIIYWINKIKGFLKKRRENKEVLEVEDRGLVYAIYIVSYFSLVPLFTDSITGLVSFVIIIAVIYSVYMNSDIVFYNPVLGLMGYKLYVVKVQDKGKIYLLTKSKKIDEKEDIEIHGITDYVYVGDGEKDIPHTTIPSGAKPSKLDPKLN